ncbi:hypothetical protein [Nocardia sp. NPDC057227]|uniref:hypothetical protein n=1 Tax=Nocardia sp. NPDC057227 TaxID=3346056 RepID=UPI00362C9497
MSTIRAFGVAAIAAGIVLGGSGVASAQTDVGTGSANFADGLTKLLVTGSGGVKPLPTPIVDGYPNPYLDGWSAGSSNLLTGLGNLIGSGSAGK